MLTLEMIQDAQAALRGIARRTPLEGAPKIGENLYIKSENLQLQKKIDEIRMVDRAKCALIQYLSMTEPQAHRYIEKQAMDRRQTRMQIAQSIIKIYEP